MKTSYITILVLATAAVLSTTALHCRAAEDVNKKEDSIWSEDVAKGEHGRFEPTEERIERIMNQLVATEPNRAEQLKQLQQKDPEKFKVEIRKVMREQFGKRFKERLEEQAGRPMRRRGEPFGPGGMPPGAVQPGMDMPWRYDKYLGWLKENYADEAEKLEEAKKLAERSGKDADLWHEYWKQFGLSFKKYGRIEEAARENLQLAEVLKKDLALRQQQDKLLGEIETAGDKEKEELVKELKEVINNRFDVIVERKQIEYEQLLKKLERLKSEVEQRKAKMEKWKDAKFKEDSVKARIEELLGKSDKFTW